MILINKDWALDADQYNIIVLQHKTYKDKATGENKEQWVPQSYHGSYEQAYLWVLEQSVRQAPQEVNALMAAMKKAHADIITAIKAQGIKCRRCSIGDGVA